MSDLVLRTFNGVATHESYGGKTLEVNLANAEKAIAKMLYTERIWDRSRSQFMLKFLTCSNADPWLRLRQISAEMTVKRFALQEAKFKYMKGLTEAKIKRAEMEKETDENKKLYLEIEATELEVKGGECLVMVEGALKEVETLGSMHDSLVAQMGDISEEEFELGQSKAHIKRAVGQAIREVKECGKIRTGNAEYIEQCGLCTTSILKEIFIFIEEESRCEVLDTSMLHKFLDAVADKYGDAFIEHSKRLGFNPNADKNLTYTP